MGKISTGGCHLVISEVPGGKHRRMGGHARQVRQGPQEPKPIQGAEEPYVPCFVYVSMLILTSAVSDVTMNQLKRDIEKEEAKQIESGQSPLYKVSPAGFFRIAIEIEDQQ